MKLSTPLTALLCAVAMLALPLSADPSVGAEVGVASAVRNDVEGIQGGTSRALSLGSRVFERELIRTGVESVAQLLFLDQTTLSVGPESEVTLDRFVYDPTRNSGDVLLSTARGALRFISGTQNPLNYKITTPNATIGVRGTIVNVLQYGAGTTVVADQGTVVIDVGGQTYTLKAGKALAIGPGGKVSGPYTFDGVLTAFKHGVPWPLYPGVLPTESWEVEVPDDSTIRIEDLFDEELEEDEPVCDIPCECFPCDIPQ
jgi:hypothetical protein